jgi:orotate phosphoribosyltransferase
MKDLMSLLFETNAFKICEENKPFWYTSGKIGPYFVNTHFLYGNAESAQEFLDFIDIQLENVSKDLIPANLFEKVLAQYQNNEIYKLVVDNLKSFIESELDLSTIDYISGGERRDWYFSIIIAYLLKKPHITIYKDLSAVVSNYDFTESSIVTKLEGKKVLHIADLLNTASSYLRAWIPAIEAFGAKITSSVVVVDRMQGGSSALNDHEINSLSLLQIDENLFKKAKELGIINESQLNMLNKFTENPDQCMRDFLIKHPEFLENAINSEDAKTAKRAKACKEQNLYNL